MHRCAKSSGNSNLRKIHGSTVVGFQNGRFWCLCLSGVEHFVFPEKLLSLGECWVLGLDGGCWVLFGGPFASENKPPLAVGILAWKHGQHRIVLAI